MESGWGGGEVVGRAGSGVGGLGVDSPTHKLEIIDDFPNIFH